MKNDNETTTPQAPDIDDIIAVIDPKNEVAIRALLAFKRRLEALELESVVHRSFINNISAAGINMKHNAAKRKKC